MTDLFWPGDHRAGDLMSDTALMAGLVAVENAWLAALVEAAVAPQAAHADLAALVGSDDATTIADGAERDGNPVTGLVALLRERAGADTARWLHRGLTSQDVVDTAVMACLRDALEVITAALTAQVHTLIGLTESNRDAPMLARTLTQPASSSRASRCARGARSPIRGSSCTTAGSRACSSTRCSRTQ